MHGDCCTASKPLAPSNEVDHPHAQHVAPAIRLDALHRHAIAQPAKT
ncbi:MAG: hypothetical protein ACREP0_11070 [Rhodanobacteraceae bacterium]